MGLKIHICSVNSGGDQQYLEHLQQRYQIAFEWYNIVDYRLHLETPLRWFYSSPLSHSLWNIVSYPRSQLLYNHSSNVNAWIIHKCTPRRDASSTKLFDLSSSGKRSFKISFLHRSIPPPASRSLDFAIMPLLVLWFGVLRRAFSCIPLQFLFRKKSITIKCMVSNPMMSEFLCLIYLLNIHFLLWVLLCSI